MRLFIILMLFLISCGTLKEPSKSNPKLELRYYSDSCDQYVEYDREYITDSSYVERMENRVDSLILKGGQLFTLRQGSVYKIIDTEEDFIRNRKVYRYYFYGVNAVDTILKPGESYLRRNIRLEASVFAVIPFKEALINGKSVFLYYLIGDCYPLSDEKCIESSIINGHYTILHFENGIGYVGYQVGKQGCRFDITAKSHEILKSKINK